VVIIVVFCRFSVVMFFSNFGTPGFTIYVIKSLSDRRLHKDWDGVGQASGGPALAFPSIGEETQALR